MIDDPPYDVEEDAVIHDPLRVVDDCYDCGAKRGEMHWPTCASMWASDDDEDDEL
ncbi:hypothetical protein [Nonomuraea basaltis]|uniref:hypothetical protein n=1 Tax=Nonomuraea basaltis TaxID=2495887 RepID=UPI00148618A8|nr:hypothetical protein [Nonomuraea basaltis]